MSISFFSSDAPEIILESYACYPCQGEPGHTQCCECHGTGVYEVKGYANECNFANGNAYRVFDALELEADYCGAWEQSQLPLILLRIKQEIATYPSLLMHEEDVAMVRRLRLLHRTLHMAIRNGYRSVVWG